MKEADMEMKYGQSHSWDENVERKTCCSGWFGEQHESDEYRDLGRFTIQMIDLFHTCGARTRGAPVMCGRAERGDGMRNT
jgi:hypothetical protein